MRVKKIRKCIRGCSLKFCPGKDWKIGKEANLEMIEVIDFRERKFKRGEIIGTSTDFAGGYCSCVGRDRDGTTMEEIGKEKYGFICNIEFLDGEKETSILIGLFEPVRYNWIKL